MRVLWFSVNPSMYNEKFFGGWVSSLELAFRKYAKDIELGIAFEYDSATFKERRDNVTYYPIKKCSNIVDKLRLQIDINANWKLLRPKCLDIVNDFRPDIIQCFGSEWDWGFITMYVNVPVVIHMQGFLNAYYIAGRFVVKPMDYFKYYNYNPLQLIRYRYRTWKEKKALEKERNLMAMNRYFLGRTTWDKNIVMHLSPKAKYFHCDEVIRPEIYKSTKKWTFSKDRKMRLITISSASNIKGNGLILETANILKTFNVDFEWKIAGNKSCFNLFESITGLKHENLNITLLGIINAETITDVLCESDFFIQTSIIDNSPNALCEAQLLGIPIISTYVGGIPSLVEDGKTGFFYPYNEPFALAFKIMELYGKKDLLEDVSRNEYEISHKRHNPQQIVRSLVNIYNKIIYNEQRK